MSHLALHYNPIRGGFLLQLSPFERSKDKKISISEGLVDVYQSAESRVLAIESAWSHGGLYLHDLHSPSSLEGKFNAEGPTHEIKGNPLFCLQQDEDIFSLWFSTPPTIGGLGSFLCQKEGGIRTSLWFSSQWRPIFAPKEKPRAASKSELLKGDTSRSVAGIQLKFSTAAAGYPIESIEFKRID